ncbi:hypothetical protein KAH94_05045 [bacterium]|nr:hypothetical protein [bacterium]
MKKLFLISFFILLTICLFGQKEEDPNLDNLNFEKLTFYLETGANFMVPENGFFIPLQYMHLIARLPENFINMTLDTHINKLQNQLTEAKFWSDFWFISTCVTGAIAIGLTIYIVADYAINHRALVFAAPFRF